ncbi:hypothetical protein RAH32_20245 [Paracoccus sp. WLY502]|jgi:hypothetical protein|uniref:hypothetical protein n=1 Tax=Paracoccus yibinensis TaxID=3068891 RepID=UPI0027966B0C|nr:hypothetical protein [Paracoccus sp. WLY502]MDQ1902756.1 hypothetical protein [Paracoccus sp. WLY502]
MRNHGAMARLMKVLMVLALVLAPVIIITTHGPAAIAAAEEIAAHGHSHDDDGGVLRGHDATDHEHQNIAVLVGKNESEIVFGDGARMLVTVTAEGWPPDLPRRPPRL